MWCFNLLLTLFLFHCTSSFFIPKLEGFKENRAADEALPWYVVEGEPDVCQTTGCLESAETLKAGINPGEDPCNDFYAYACSGWQKRNPIPATESQWNQFNVVDRKLDFQLRDIFEEVEKPDTDPHPVHQVKDFYLACMDVERREQLGVRPLSELLSALGGWPIAQQQQWREERFDVLRTLGFLTRNLAATPLTTVYVYMDRKNSSRSVVTVDQGSLVLPRAMMTQPALYKRQLAAYAEWIVGAARLLGATADDHQLIKEAHQIVQFETHLAELTAPSEDRRDAYRMYNSMSVRQLQKWTDSVHKSNGKQSVLQWDQLLKHVFHETKISVSTGERMMVREMEYLLRLEVLLQKTPPRLLANYLLWRAVKSVGRDSSASMRHLSFSFDKVFSGVAEDQPLWVECVSRATSALPFAAGFQYVKRYFDSESKTNALAMVHHIRRAFLERVQHLEWMDDQTKLAAKEKALSMTEFIGFPDWFANSTALNHYYQGADIGKDHFQNVRRMTSLQVKRVFDRLREVTDRNDWLTGPAVVNAYYNPLTNSIAFPAGILQIPFFAKDTIEALNYGSIGVIIGHEITHGFDDMGRQNDKDGNLVQWWTPDTEYAYLEKALCIVEQYDAMRVPELDELLGAEATMNGVTTQGENIADNGGIEQALQAYHQFVKEHGPEKKLPGLKYTPEQLFFLGFASVWCESSSPESLLHEVLSNPHAPHRHRVNGPLSNSQHFANAWQCKTGSAMNPQNKCQVW